MHPTYLIKVSVVNEEPLIVRYWDDAGPRRNDLRGVVVGRFANCERKFPTANRRSIRVQVYGPFAYLGLTAPNRTSVTAFPMMRSQPRP